MAACLRLVYRVALPVRPDGCSEAGQTWRLGPLSLSLSFVGVATLLRYRGGAVTSADNPTHPELIAACPGRAAAAVAEAVRSIGLAAGQRRSAGHAGRGPIENTDTINHSPCYLKPGVFWFGFAVSEPLYRLDLSACRTRGRPANPSRFDDVPGCIGASTPGLMRRKHLTLNQS